MQFVESDKSYQHQPFLGFGQSFILGEYCTSELTELVIHQGTEDSPLFFPTANIIHED